MTLQEFTREVNDRFLFQISSRNILTEASHYATNMARQYWPEVYEVTASYDDSHKHVLMFNLTFNSHEDYMWWTLKNG